MRLWSCIGFLVAFWAVGAEAQPFSSPPEVPTNCLPEPDAPTPFERTTAPRGSRWWVAAHSAQPIEVSDIATGVLLDPDGNVVHPQKNAFASSVAIAVPRDAIDGQVYSLVFSEIDGAAVPLTVGDAEPLSSSATLLGVNAVELRGPECSCTDGARDLRVAITVTSGPVVIEAEPVETPDDGLAPVVSGLLVPPGAGETTVLVTVGSSVDTTPTPFPLHVVLKEPETLLTLASEDFELDENGIPNIPPPASVRDCRGGSGCGSTSSSSAWPALVACWIFAVKQHRRRSTAALSSQHRAL